MDQCFRRFRGLAIVFALLVGARVQGQHSCGPAVLTLHGDLCAPLESFFDVEIHMTNVPIPVAGGQFFIEYSATNLELVDVGGGNPPSPFNFPVFFDGCFPELPECTRELLEQMIPCCTRRGYIDFAVGIQPGGSATRQDSMMARFTFRVINDETEPFVRFRRWVGENPEAGTILGTTAGGGIIPQTVDAEPPSQDLRDFADLQNCFEPDAGEAGIGCRCHFDSDHDNDVDASDAAEFQSNFNGPGSFGCG